uniref:Uncharacterized protein n=1 Tax=Cacopsylla melanoneura TaxID=428564 RepID=A0A8D8X1B6_9HEMI
MIRGSKFVCQVTVYLIMIFIPLQLFQMIQIHNFQHRARIVFPIEHFVLIHPHSRVVLSSDPFSRFLIHHPNFFRQVVVHKPVLLPQIVQLEHLDPFPFQLQ